MASGGTSKDFCDPLVADTEDTNGQGVRPGEAKIEVNQHFVINQTNVENKFNNSSIIFKFPQSTEPPPRQAPTPPYDYNDPAFFEPSKPKDVSILFSDEELDRKVEDVFLTKVAKAVDRSKSWRKLARRLKLDSKSFGEVENYQKDGIQEMVYQCLKIWKRRNPGVTVRDLVARLVESDLHDAALELQHSFHSLYCLE